MNSDRAARPRGARIARTLALALMFATTGGAALAQGHGGHGGGHGGYGGGGYHGGGHWEHGWHNGGYGWWWFAVPPAVYLWSLPPARPEPPPTTVIIESAPPATVAAPAANAPAPSWYFCEASRSYYPYVATCPGGWRQVPAVPSSAPADINAPGAQ